MKVIAEKPWSYVLFENDQVFFITLLLGGVVDVDVTVKLTLNEIANLKTDISNVELLVERIRTNWDTYSSRQISPSIWPPN